MTLDSRVSLAFVSNESDNNPILLDVQCVVYTLDDLSILLQCTT